MLNSGLNKFLETFFTKINEKDVDVSTLYLDHLAYQASSSQDYEDKKVEFAEIAKLVNEAIVGGRRVGIFKLTSLIKYQKRKIPTIEIIEPKQDQIVKSSWEHAEFVLTDSYEEFMKKYPNLEWDTSSMHRHDYSHLKLKLSDNMQVKFHDSDILDIVEAEKKDVNPNFF